MFGTPRIRLSIALTAAAALALALALAACGGKKDDEKEPAGEGDPTSGTTKDDTGKTPRIGGNEPASKTVFSYPPAGPGPHEGFDLGAIRQKLQGAWLVGGSAFSNIPTVWYLDGDTVVQITESGERTETNLQLLAPCYMFEGTKGSGTYGHFAFDGDTLYMGLGNAGIVAGDKTIGCMSVTMYVYENGTCTAWTKKPFATEGDMWESEPGDCGYTDDKKVFYGDDTNSKRKTYGRQELNVHGNVLLTRQMEGNKAQRFDTLAAALAEQKKLIDAKAALQQTPTDLPFAAWGVESSQPSHAEGAPVWAAAVSREGTWSLGAFRYKKFDNGAVWVASGHDAWAPSSFVHAPPGVAGLKKGDPALLGIGALMPYGKFVKMEGDKAVFAYKSARQVKEQALEPDRVMPFAAGQWVFAAPVAYKNGDMWVDGRLVMDAGDHAYVLTSDGVQKLAKTDVKLVPASRKWKKGATVWAMQPSGMSPLKYVKGKIVEIHGDDVYYTIETDDGKKLDQTFARIVDGL